MLNQYFINIKNIFTQKDNKYYKVFFFLIFFILLFILVPYIIPIPDLEKSSPEDIDITQFIESSFIEIDGYRTFIIDRGKENKNVITFLHGFGGSSLFWLDNLDYLVNKGYRTIAIDLKGFGLSQKGFKYSYDHRSQAEFVYKILTKLGIEKTNLVGHSMGGNIALHFSYLYPDMLDKLVLVAPAIIETDNIFVSAFSNLITLPPFSRYVSHFVLRFFDLDNFRNFLLSTVYKKDGITEDRILQFYKPLTISGWNDSLLGITRDGYKNKIPEDVFSSLSSKEILLVVGSHDSIVAVDIGLNYNLKIPNLILKVIKDVGHLPMIESPIEFNSILVDFLQK